MCDVIMMSLGLYSNVWQRLIIISIQVVKGQILCGVPSIYQNLPRYTYWRELRELREFKRNNEKHFSSA